MKTMEDDVISRKFENNNKIPTSKDVENLNLRKKSHKKILYRYLSSFEIDDERLKDA